MCTVCNAYVRTGGGERSYWLRPLLAISPSSIFPDYHTWTLISNDRRCFYNHQRQLQSSLSSLCRWQERSTIFSPFLCRDSQIVKRESADKIWSFNNLTVRFRWSRGSVLAFGTQVRRVQTRSKPSDFLGEKILSTPSFGGEVKPSVPCRALRHVKEQKWRGSRHFRQNFSAISRPQYHLPLLGSLASLQKLGASCGESWNALNPWFSSKLGVGRAAGNGTL
jgi:hypothetical protein